MSILSWSLVIANKSFRPKSLAEPLVRMAWAVNRGKESRICVQIVIKERAWSGSVPFDQIVTLLRKSLSCSALFCWALWGCQNPDLSNSQLVGCVTGQDQVFLFNCRLVFFAAQSVKEFFESSVALDWYSSWSDFYCEPKPMDIYLLCPFFPPTGLEFAICDLIYCCGPPWPANLSANWCHKLFFN